MVKYSLTSTRQKDETIEHEPSRKGVYDSSYQAKRMKEMHEELMFKINPEIDKIKMIITEKPEKSFLTRLLRALTHWR